MGALKLKSDKEWAFLDDDQSKPKPPWSKFRELQQGAAVLAGDGDPSEIKKWFSILLAPGSSVGGVGPKANIAVESGNLWFPPKAIVWTRVPGIIYLTDWHWNAVLK